MTIEITIIIPTFNRTGMLKACVDSLLEQDFRHRYEIAVINDGSDAETTSLIKSYIRALAENKKSKIRCAISYHFQKNKGPASARNLGLRHARGRIIVFLDDDCHVDKSWISRIYAAHKKWPMAGAIAGRLLPAGKGIISDFSYSFESAHYHDLKDGQKFKPSLVNNVSYKRSAIGKIRFNEQLRTAEDVVFNYELYINRTKTCFTSSIIAYHHYKDRLADFMKQEHGFGRGRAYLMMFSEDYPEDKSDRVYYVMKMLAIPFLSPFFRIRYALKNKKNFIGFFIIGIAQQMAYWSGFIIGIFGRMFD